MSLRSLAFCYMIFVGALLLIFIVALATGSEPSRTLEQRLNALENRVEIYHQNMKPPEDDIEKIVGFRREVKELTRRIEALENKEEK